MDGRGKPFMAKIRYKFITFREYETEAFAEYLEYTESCDLKRGSRKN